MNKPHSCLTLLAITTALLLTPFASAIELGSPFLDNAILQRGMDVPVWGWSKPGATVTVEFAGQKADAKAGAAGKWMLKLKPLKANATPDEMTVSNSDGQKVVLKNILVGEVWHASGQSNMEWFAGKSNCVTMAAEMVKATEEAPIRG